MHTSVWHKRYALLSLGILAITSASALYTYIVHTPTALHPAPTLLAEACVPTPTADAPAATHLFVSCSGYLE